MKQTANSRATLLVVDDNPTILGMLDETLSQFHYQVLVANTGEQALQQATLAQPELILLDVMMPGVDGFETCRRLKADPQTQAIPIIFMTALTDPINEVTGLQLGAVDYISKPIQLPTALARIETHLTKGRLQQELQEQIAELDAFAHTVAHELKNPAGIMVSFAEILTKYFPELPDHQRLEYIQCIQTNGRKMVNIVDELLLLAQLRREDVSFEPVNMTQVVKHVLSRLNFMVEEYQAKIILPKRWPIALGYAAWIEEIWVNYVSNALKYGGQPPVVELGAELQAKDTIRFWVKDNGPGLTPEAQQHLFTEFTRLDDLRFQGHGLGLSIVRRIGDKLGGRVGVESQGLHGQGCLFYFVLPAA